ncbi:hypothetical protein LOTGIDRAFT_154813 [Lottia gigantea]|uniref:Uncharacterized protein n=1 Tax=Lottia gigantea TaxID=225164 RepID=V3ZSF7_LOTGI|nr:hypothetical protein LOTGIDRAFT_154813 [Lottia gigantea]ESO87317.1 hypothetical protein LOTGIDRAFT_154813 [Lottia gigantea]
MKRLEKQTASMMFRLNEGIDHGMAKISALLLDAAAFISKHSESNKCRLLLSVNDKYKTLVAISRQFGFISSHIHETGHQDGKQCDLMLKTKDDVEILSSYTIHETEIRLNNIKFKSPTS